LKERILKNIRAESASRKVTRFPMSTVIPWALAAGLAVFCGLLFFEQSKLKGEIAQLRNKNDVCQMEVSMLNMMDRPKQAGTAVVVWDSSTQTGIMKGEDMPRPAANEDYQLWAMDEKHPTPVNAGIFTVDEKGRAVVMFKLGQSVSESSKFVVSVEPKGGVEQHDNGPIIMMSK